MGGSDLDSCGTTGELGRLKQLSLGSASVRPGTAAPFHKAIFSCIISIVRPIGKTGIAIANAVERGDYAYVYDEKNRQLFSIPLGSGPQYGLHGFTGRSVSIRRGEYIYTYDQTGHQISYTPAR